MEKKEEISIWYRDGFLETSLSMREWNQSSIRLSLSLQSAIEMQNRLLNNNIDELK